MRRLADVTLATKLQFQPALRVYVPLCLVIIIFAPVWNEKGRRSVSTMELIRAELGLAWSRTQPNRQSSLSGM